MSSHIQNDFATYLGDALYASWNGQVVILMANDLEHPTDTVYLEPDVMQALINYWNGIKEKNQ